MGVTAAGSHLLKRSPLANRLAPPAAGRRIGARIGLAVPFASEPLSVAVEL
jgi:hypothetical protein